MKDRHWIKVNQILSDKKIDLFFDPNKFYFIKTLRESGLKDIIKEIEEISDFAYKEYQNEQILNEIDRAWGEVQIELIPYKIQNSFILTSNVVDEIQILLEDHFVKIQTMKSSQYAQVYKD
jgi:dynein heavy chain